MRRPGLSLQSRFYAAILVLLAIVVLVMVLLWQRQQASQHNAPADPMRIQNRVSRAARKKLSRMGVQSSSSTPPAE